MLYVSKIGKDNRIGLGFPYFFWSKNVWGSLDTIKRWY